MRYPKSYTLEEFIHNMSNRKNMFRHDKVSIDFSELEHVKSVNGNSEWKYYVGKNSYKIYVYKDGNKYICGMIWNGYEYDFGEIGSFDDLETYHTYVPLECDIKFV